MKIESIVIRGRNLTLSQIAVLKHNLRDAGVQWTPENETISKVGYNRGIKHRDYC